MAQNGPKISLIRPHPPNIRPQICNPINSPNISSQIYPPHPPPPSNISYLDKFWKHKQRYSCVNGELLMRRSTSEIFPGVMETQLQFIIVTSLSNKRYSYH